MNRRQIFFLFFILLFLVILFEVFKILATFFHPLFWSIVLVFGFYPLHLKLKSCLKGHDSWAAALTTLIILLVVLPLLLLILTNLISEALHVYQVIATYVADGKYETLLVKIEAHTLIQRLKAHDRIWDFVKEHSESWLLHLLRALGNFVAAQLKFITMNVMLFVVNFFLTLFLCFFFLRDGEKIYRFIYDMIPLEEENKALIFSRINETFSAVLKGQLLTAIVQGILAGTIFFFLGLPLPVLFGAATFLFSLVPFLGAAVVWVPNMIYLFVIQHYTQGFILLFLGIFGISLVDNFLKPILIGQKTKLPYLVLFLGILGGLKIYGLAGIFFAPMILSLFFVLVKIYREKILSSDS